MKYTERRIFNFSFKPSGREVMSIVTKHELEDWSVFMEAYRVDAPTTPFNTRRYELIFERFEA